MTRIRKFLQRFRSQKQEIVYEKCVLCGAEIKISVTTPIEERKDYIQGCGQLCTPCRSKIHRGSPYIE